MRRASSLFLVWLAVWPLVMIGLTLVERFALHWPLPLRTLLLTAVLVPLISFVITPVTTHAIAKWDLRPSKRTVDAKSPLRSVSEAPTLLPKEHIK